MCVRECCAVFFLICVVYDRPFAVCYTYKHTSTCTYICIYVYMCKFIYIYIYIYELCVLVCVGILRLLYSFCVLSVTSVSAQGIWINFALFSKFPKFSRRPLQELQTHNRMILIAGWLIHYRAICARIALFRRITTGTQEAHVPRRTHI